MTGENGACTTTPTATKEDEAERRAVHVIELRPIGGFASKVQFLTVEKGVATND